MVSLSPFFREFHDVLTRRGVRLRIPDVALAHPLDGDRAAVLTTDLAATARGLGVDEKTYSHLMGPYLEDAPALAASILAPLRRPPSAPLTMARFGLRGLAPATRLASHFETDEARALIAGLCGHSMLPLEHSLTSAIGLFLAVTAHSGGWPVIEGGSGALVQAFVDELRDLGVAVQVERPITQLSDLPDARAVLFDTSAPALVRIAGDRLPPRYRAGVARFQRGSGVFKVDWALSQPVPWRNADCARAGTVHVGGTFEEIATSESEVGHGRHAEHPYCLVVQAGVADPTRAPQGQHTLWAYCHVPNGSDVDMTSRIEDQLERFAPGFRDTVLARVTTSNADAERHNPNYLGGDITGGAGTLRQTVFRPTVRWNPYRTGAKGIYLCSSSTPPGGGVHGMCGWGAAQTVISDLHHRGGVARSAL
jgi:phytoene dehydrogenase-like protein